MTLTPPGGEQAATPLWLTVLAGTWLLLSMGGLVMAALDAPGDLCRAEASAGTAGGSARVAQQAQRLAGGLQARERS